MESLFNCLLAAYFTVAWTLREGSRRKISPTSTFLFLLVIVVAVSMLMVLDGEIHLKYGWYFSNFHATFPFNFLTSFKEITVRSTAVYFGFFPPGEDLLVSDTVVGAGVGDAKS